MLNNEAGEVLSLLRALSCETFHLGDAETGSSAAILTAPATSSGVSSPFPSSGAGREVPVLSGGLRVRLYQQPPASLLTEAKRKVVLLVPGSSFDVDYYLIILIVVQFI